MRPLACSALAVCLSSTALAQSVPASSGLPSPAKVSSRDTLTVGAGVASIPDYEGSDDYQTLPVGAVRGKYRGISFHTSGTYLYVDFLPGSGKATLDAGPVVGLRFDRRHRSDDLFVSKMTRRKTAIEAGAFAGASVHGLIDRYDTLSFHLAVLHDVGNAHKSTLFAPNISFSTPVSRRTYISLSGGAEFVSRRFATYYFGVTAADVLATGGALPPYSPRKGGMKNWKTSLLINQSITGDLLGGLSVFGLGQYSRLVGDFKRSPIVAERGSANQWLGAVGLAYTW